MAYYTYRNYLHSPLYLVKASPQIAYLYTLIRGSQWRVTRRASVMADGSGIYKGGEGRTRGFHGRFRVIGRWGCVSRERDWIYLQAGNVSRIYIWVYREGLRNMLLKYGIGGGKYSGGGMYSEWEKDWSSFKYFWNKRWLPEGIWEIAKWCAISQNF